jgi:PilZ domain
MLSQRTVTMAVTMPSALPVQPTPLVPAPSPERRRASRYEVSVPVEVSTLDGVPLSSEVTNISASGFRAHSAMALRKGSKVIVRFENGMRRRAYVAWQIGEDIGCRMLRPLTADELAGVIESQSLNLP